jgi:hypothetical protein
MTMYTHSPCIDPPPGNLYMIHNTCSQWRTTYFGVRTNLLPSLLTLFRYLKFKITNLLGGGGRRGRILVAEPVICYVKQCVGSPPALLLFSTYCNFHALEQKSSSHPPHFSHNIYQLHVLSYNIWKYTIETWRGGREGR